MALPGSGGWEGPPGGVAFAEAFRNAEGHNPEGRAGRLRVGGQAGAAAGVGKLLPGLTRTSPDAGEGMVRNEKEGEPPPRKGGPRAEARRLRFLHLSPDLAG